MKPIIRNPQQGCTVSLVGDVYRFLATGEDTNCKYTLIEALVGPGGGPPPHVHSREEEGFYVLEGEITLFIGDQRLVEIAGAPNGKRPFPIAQIKTLQSQPLRGQRLADFLCAGF